MFIIKIRDKMKLIYIYTVLVMMLVVGCTSFDADNRLEEALTMADLNRTEMEKVLSHYEENSMKKEAAKFLIRNMPRSEEHTSELQSRQYLVCRLLLEKK